MKKESLSGVIFGTAVGDSLGLVFEFLNKKRHKKLYGDYERYYFFLNKGMFSDDTEHNFITASALIKSKNDTEQYKEELAKGLKWWLLALPGGIGKATMQSILKLTIGFSPDKSGVKSAGNGPGMRAALIGVCFGDNTEKMKEYIKITTRITHTDNRAEYGALAIALAAYFSGSKEKIEVDEYFEKLYLLFENAEYCEEFKKEMETVKLAVKNGKTSEEFLKENNMGRGVTGFIVNTVKAVLFVWLNNTNDFDKAIKTIISFGGDTDTTAAILGGIIGARVGKGGIKREYIENIWDIQRNEKWIEELSAKLYLSLEGDDKNIAPPKINFIFVLLRNVFFDMIVLLHGLRRLLPI